MAVEREINSRTDLTLDEAVKERLELIEYRKSADWTSWVLEKVDRRIADLNNLIAEDVTVCLKRGDIIVVIRCIEKNFNKIMDFFNGLNS